MTNKGKARRKTMEATITIDEGKTERAMARILVVGAGGGGGNAVDNMVEGDVRGVTFIAANTDMQALMDSRADHTIQLGTDRTRGLGAGADPAIGRESALEDKNRIMEFVRDYDMVFVTAGMGGGTGTGAAPIIAEAARSTGALAVGVVTKPFSFEGLPRMRNAEQGIKELKKHVDALIVIPNDRLTDICNEPMSLLDSFALADGVLRDAVRSISDIIVVKGLVNVDFADARRIMLAKGKTIMGMGEGSGEGRAAQAAQRAMTSSLLEETSIEGATGVLVNIAGGPDLKIQELNEAMRLIQKAADDTAEIIMGCVLRPDMTDKIKITIIATGFDVDREFDAQPAIASEMPQETASPGAHWPTQQTRRGMLNATAPRPAHEPAPRQGALRTPERSRVYAQHRNPPPIPRQQQLGATPRRTPAVPQTTEQTPPAEGEVDFDPMRTSDWFEYED